MLLHPGFIPSLSVTIHCSSFLNSTHGYLILHCLLSASPEWKLLEDFVLFNALFLFIFKKNISNVESIADVNALFLVPRIIPVT